MGIFCKVQLFEIAGYTHWWFNLQPHQYSTNEKTIHDAPCLPIPNTIRTAIRKLVEYRRISALHREVHGNLGKAKRKMAGHTGYLQR